MLALASEAEVQESLYPSFVSVCDELALDFDDALKLNPLDRQEAGETLRSIDAAFARMSGDKGLWDGQSLRSSVEWENLRKLAKAALLDLGVDHQIPVPSGGKFVSGKVD